MVYSWRIQMPRRPYLWQLSGLQPAPRGRWCLDKHLAQLQRRNLEKHRFVNTSGLLDGEPRHMVYAYVQPYIRD